MNQLSLRIRNHLRNVLWHSQQLFNNKRVQFVFYLKIISNKIKEIQEILRIKDYQIKAYRCMLSIMKINLVKIRQQQKIKPMDNNQVNKQRKAELKAMDKTSRKRPQLQRMLTLWFKNNKELSRPNSHKINLTTKKIFWNNSTVMKSTPNWWKSSKKENCYTPTWKKRIKESHLDQSWVLSNLRINLLNQCKEGIWIMSTKIKATINRMQMWN